MSNERIVTLLEEGWQSLQRGGSIDAFLARHPEEAEELQPLLESIVTLRVLRCDPSGEFAHAARSRFLEAAAMRAAAPNKSSRGLLLSCKRLAVPIGAAAVLLASGAGVLTASADALPGNPLYVVQQAREHVAERIALTPEQRASIQLAYVGHQMALLARARQAGAGPYVTLRLEEAALRATERAAAATVILPPRERRPYVRRLAALIREERSQPVPPTNAQGLQERIRLRNNALQQLDRTVSGQQQSDQTPSQATPTSPQPGSIEAGRNELLRRWRVNLQRRIFHHSSVARAPHS
ncbi:MAG: hypothetical protein M1296_01930 [Chloroflexi bacterium]|nr:hypothetical protein [Chloroflexota bacterium]